MLSGSMNTAGTDVPFSSVMGNDAVGISMRDLTRSVTHGKHGKPVSFPLGVARPQGRATAVRVEDGGKSEGPTVMAGIRVATSPGAKASRLPPGLPSRENLANRPNGISR